MSFQTTLLSIFILLFALSCSRTDESQNNLKNERSSYLQKSQKSGIHWKAWDEALFKQAAKEDRLLFINLGYASCASCDQMLKTSFRDKNLQDFLNQHFIAIQVDREEHPEVNNFLMSLQAHIMGFAGWPMNFLLTPDLKPVYAMTFTQPGELLSILKKSQNSWESNRTKMLSEIDRFMEATKIQEDHLESFDKNYDLIDDFYARYTHLFDPLYGGKGQKQRGRLNFANKFPVHNDMRLLLRYHLRTKEPQALKMVEKTLTSLAKSALFDHLAGGFHLYSTTRNWNTPHFEKSLVDQASALQAYMDIYQIKPNDLYRRTIEKTVKFLVNQMRAPLGGFYTSVSGQTPDNRNSFYLWNPVQLRKKINNEDHRILLDTYAFDARDPKNRSLSALRRKTSFFKDETKKVEDHLLSLRNQRPQPLKDQTVVTSANAYVLSALARFNRLWRDEAFYRLIKKELHFILNQHQTLQGHLMHRSIRGETRFAGTLDDYSFLIDALIEFYQTSFDVQYLKKAKKLQDDQIRLFYESEKGLFHFAKRPQLFPKQFLLRDLNQPSGQSMTYWNMIRLATYFNDKKLRQIADRILDVYPDTLKTDPLSYAYLLLALDYDLAGSQKIYINDSIENCQKKTTEISSSFKPRILFACQSPLFSKTLKERLSDKSAPLHFCTQEECWSNTEAEHKISGTY